MTLCPVCQQENTKYCPRMTLGQSQQDVETLASEGCKFALDVIKVQERTYGTVKGDDAA